MTIDKTTTTLQIEEAFIADFPYLKIKFYKKGHEQFHGSPKNEEIQNEMKLERLNPQLPLGKLSWENMMTVDKLETIFEEQFGLHVQVFRQSGEQWLQTSATDHWTLEKQNKKGLESVESLTS